MTGTSTVLARTLALLGKRPHEDSTYPSASSGESVGENDFAQRMNEVIASSSANGAGEPASRMPAETASTAEIGKPESLLASLDAVLQSINSVAQADANIEEKTAASPPLPSWQSPPPASEISADILESVLAEAGARAETQAEVEVVAQAEAQAEAGSTAATEAASEAFPPPLPPPVAEEIPPPPDVFPPDFDGSQAAAEALTSEGEAATSTAEEVPATSILAPAAAEFAEPLPLLSSAAADMARFFSAPLEPPAAEPQAAPRRNASSTGTGFESWFLTPPGEEAVASAGLPTSPFVIETPDDKKDTSSSDDSADVTDLPIGSEEELGYGMPMLPEPFKPIWKGTPDQPEDWPPGGISGPFGASSAISSPSQEAPGMTGEAETATLAVTASHEDTQADTLRDLQTLMSDMKVGVVRQETHFAPSVSLPPAAQIADGIASEILDTQSATSATATRSTLSETGSGSGETVKVLHLRLDPPELGPLTVRMTLKHDALTVQLEATRPETASLIERDRETITGLLRANGYAVDGLSVQIASPASASFTGTGTQQQSTGQQSAGWQQQSGDTPGQAGQGQGHSGNRGQPAWGNANENAETGSSRGTGGALYL